MAVIVGDKLKLSNYSYLLDRDGQGFIGELQTSERRDRQEKLIDAVDLKILHIQQILQELHIILQ